MQLRPSPVNSGKFSYKDNTFVAELSSLGKFSLGKVYTDDCDLGFTIVSEKTGNVAVFVESGFDTDGEDICGFRFVCVTRGLKHLRALLIND